MRSGSWLPGRKGVRAAQDVEADDDNTTVSGADPEMVSPASRSAAAQQYSAKRVTRNTEAVDTTRDGLSQRRKSYGSEPRRKLEMSQH